MTQITPEKLRELSFAEAPHNEGVSNALLSAADEIERLRETSDKQVTELTQLKLAAMGWKQ